MRVDLEMVLTHDGDNWIAREGDLTARGKTMAELDADVVRVLREAKRFERKEHVKIFMGFDFSQIPTWLRQYHTHYFNRFVTIEL